MESLLSIGAFARKTRLSMKALRLYARLGLLPPVHVDQVNGYRWYRKSQLATARLIGMLRRLDMPLDEVAQVIAERCGGLADPVFVIYHGEVNSDSDGPVEICVPVSAGSSVDGVAMRQEPAHREAFTRITKAQVEFPQILSAYDAVAQWVSANGHSVAGSPREVYFTDWAAAGPNDEAADIAFPMR